MLARLSRTCSQLADLGRSVSSHDEDRVPVEVDDLLPPEATVLSRLSLTDTDSALESMTAVAGTCGKMFSPLYRYVESALSADVEKLVLLLHEADSDVSSDLEDEDEDIYVIPFPSSDTPALSPDDSADACTERSSNSPCLLRGVGCVPRPSVPQKLPIPRIVITPAPPQQCREMSSCVPVQDTLFGSRLTVPSHTALNACHPPMAAPSYPQVPPHTTVRAWTYRQGHWYAVVPGLDEQERRGIFSRPINMRRRAMRKRAGGVRDHSLSCQNLLPRNKRDS